jgi:hypothetical protein
VPYTQLNIAMKLLHYASVKRVFDPSKCRCQRGCWNRAGFSIADLTADRYLYLQNGTEPAKRSWLAGELTAGSRHLGEGWIYTLRSHPKVEVCSCFYQAALGISKNKMMAAREMARGGSLVALPHANTGRTYMTTKNAKATMNAFWRHFFNQRCQKPSYDLWLAPTNLPQRTSSLSPVFSTVEFMFRCGPVGHTHNEVDAIASVVSLMIRLSQPLSRL